MTPDRYFEMQEQMGLEIIEEDIPPSLEDMPELVGLAVECFNRLGDRVYPEIGYVGKDYTSLPIYLELSVDKNERDFFLQIIEWLDARAIKQSAEQLKREYDKMKRKK